MSIQVGRTIKEMEKMVKDLGISDQVTPSKKSGKFAKEDYIVPIRNYFLKERYGSLDNIPKSLELMLSVKSPMLAARIDGLKEDQQQEIWNSDEWYFEEKLNGVRCWIVQDGNGVKLFSRHNSDVDFLPIEFTDKVLFPDTCDLSKINKTFILDCEMTCDNPHICSIVGKYGVTTETELQAVTSILGSATPRAIAIQKQEDVRLTFNSFDCVFYDNQWITEEPKYRRAEVAEEIITALENCGFKIRRVKSTNQNKREFYNNLIKAGGEGAVAKKIDGIYIPDSTRGFKGWVKIKKSAMDMTGIDESQYGDTIDAYITGFNPGNKGTALENLIGAVRCSVLVMKSNGDIYEHEIGIFSGIDMKTRIEMTEVINGEPTLKASYYGRVVELDGLGLSPRSLRLNHAQFLGWRYDKLKDSCFLKEEDMFKMVSSTFSGDAEDGTDLG